MRTKLLAIGIFVFVNVLRAMESQELMDQQFDALAVNEKKEKDCKCWHLEDFEWQFYGILDHDIYGICNHIYYTPALVADKHLKAFKREIKAAGFYVNNIDRKEVALTEIQDYVCLYVNDECIKNFLAKFPTIQNSTIQ